MQLIFKEYPKELDYLRLSCLSLRVLHLLQYHMNHMETYHAYESCSIKGSSLYNDHEKIQSMS